MRLTNFALLCSLLLAGTLPIDVRAQTASDSPIARLKTYHFGGDTALLDAVTAQVDAARTNASQRPEVARELAEVLTSDAAFDAKQFVCRQLIPIAGEAQIPALAGLLKDDKLAHYALLVLARIPGKAVNDALLAEVANTHDNDRLELLNVLATRGDARAMSGLKDLLGSASPELGADAASALARFQTPEATSALMAAYAFTQGAVSRSMGKALLDSAYRYADQGNTKAATDLLYSIDGPRTDPMLRAAALRVRVRIHPETAMAEILKALHEDRTPRQSMAADLAREIPGTQATQALSDALPGLSPHGQLLLLTTLQARKDHTAAGGMTLLCQSPDAAVRLAALQSLSTLGTESALTPLLHAAAIGSPAERDAARESLARLQGAQVDAKLTALVSPQIAVNIEIITALGNRHVVSAVPRLMHDAQSSQPEIRTAALGVLRDLGNPAQLPALIDLFLATPSEQRDALGETIAAIARRLRGTEEQTAELRVRLASTTKTADRCALLTLLDQVGGPNALLMTQGALKDPTPEVRTTALNLLADWPSDEPMEDLKQVALTTTDARQRTIALRGFLRMVASDEMRPADRALPLYRSITTLLTRADDKRQVLSGLGKVHSAEALEYASSFLKDPDVRPEAEAAVVAIGRAIIGAYPEQTRAALEPIAKSGVDESTRKAAGAALELPAKLGDYIGAWEVSSVYQVDGIDYTHLFDRPFSPEIPKEVGIVTWWILPIVTDPEHPWLLDLLAFWGGEQRVAYLRSAVWSESARDLVLEMGSDDGLKVWWNGQVVLAHNVARAVAPGQEKVTVHLNAGWNSLLLKVTQNNQGWGACARFTNPDGSPATRLRYALPPKVKIAAQHAP